MEKYDGWFIYPTKGLGEKNIHFINILKEKAKKFNVSIKMIDLGKMKVSTENGGELIYEKKRVENFPNFAFFRCAGGVEIARFLESRDVKTINNSNVMTTAVDKFKTGMILANNGIRTPKTIFTQSRKISYKTLSADLGEKFIVKDNFGSRGRDVYLIKNQEDFNKIDRKNKIYQEFIESSHGKDLRILVLGRKVLGGVMRSANNKEDFKANLSQGGIATQIEITPEIEELALKVYDLFGFDFLGLDLLFDESGYTVCEINTNPGLKSFNAMDNIAISDEYFKYFLENNKFQK